MTKTLVIVRHAHRFKRPDRDADNGLSDKGRKQARAVRNRYRAENGARPALLLSSPKARCVETLLPLARLTGSRIRNRAELDEGAPGLPARCRTFLKWWQTQGPALTVACTHGDVIPVLLRLACGVRCELDKGGWAELVLESGKVRLRILEQSP